MRAYFHISIRWSGHSGFLLKHPRQYIGGVYIKHGKKIFEYTLGTDLKNDYVIIKEESEYISVKHLKNYYNIKFYQSLLEQDFTDQREAFIYLNSWYKMKLYHSSITEDKVLQIPIEAITEFGLNCFKKIIKTIPQIVSYDEYASWNKYEEDYYS